MHRSASTDCGRARAFETRPILPALVAASLLAASCGARSELGIEGADASLDAGLDAPAKPPPPAEDPGPQVAAGSSFSCWKRDGVVKCWGSNQLGELGDGTTVSDHTPVQVVGLSDVVEIAPAGWHACARRADWSVACWGYHRSGQVGDGTECHVGTCDIVRTPPVHVLSGAAALPMRGFGQHSCALMLDGSVHCWGSNPDGELCDESAGRKVWAPTPIPALANADEIAMGEYFTCARWGSELVQCCGFNPAGQLGDGTTADRAYPAPVLGLAGVASLAAGHSYACALRRDGTAVCWGDDKFGQLGDGEPTISRPLPVEVRGLEQAVALAAGDDHTCALLADRTVQCWGSNEHGQLGDGTTIDRLEPTPVAGLVQAVEIAAGQGFSCARLARGPVLCWGFNHVGQLGDGTTTDRHAPNPVNW